MIDRNRIMETLKSKIAHAKSIDRDSVYIPVWQAKQIVEHLEPMKPRKTVNGFTCDNCGHQLVNTGYYYQKHCDECGQSILWQEEEK